MAALFPGSGTCALDSGFRIAAGAWIRRGPQRGMGVRLASRTRPAGDRPASRIANCSGAVGSRPTGVGMTVGRTYPPEWRDYQDLLSGRQVRQLTDSPAEDYHLYFYNPSITPDGK